jgi:hypothetical protein
MSATASTPCSSAAPQDPHVVSNPPGLPMISYRVDDFTGFRRALLRPLNDEQAIGAWRPAAGDLGLQVLEWWAYLADVLTFYNERIANENYLATATRASSVANLVALLGFQPAPGIAASGSVAAVRKPGHPAEPLVIPAGMKISSVATPGIPSQVFEVDPGASFTGPSSVPITLPAQTTLAPNPDGTLSVLLAGRVSGVKPGDQLVLVDKSFDGTLDNWAQVTVSALAPVTDPGTGAVNTLVTLSAPGSGWQQSLPWLLVLGYFDSDCTNYRLMRPTGTAALWNQAQSLILGQSGYPVDLPVVHMSSVVRAISPGEIVLFDHGSAGGALAQVTASVDAMGVVTNPNGAAQPGVIIAHTELTLALWWFSSWALILSTGSPPDGSGTQPAASIAVRYGFKDVGTIIGTPQATLSSLPATGAMPAAQAPPVGARALLQDATGAGVAVTITAVTVSGGSAAVTLTGAGTPPAAIATPLAVPLQLLLDVVGVSRGTTVTDEALGSGDAALANQSFTLAKSPLTYLVGPTSPTSTLAVHVDGVQWQEVPSFYAQAPDARVFVVSRSADQTVTTVTFGDGVNGARLSTGNANVLASYRYGCGAVSPPAGRLTTILQPQANLGSIQNPVAVSGGADPQAAADVRSEAPASVATLGRAISATDYEFIARQAPGVTRATAYWTFVGAAQRTLVTVYVGDDEAAVTAARTALAGAEDPNRPVSVLAAIPNEIGLSGTLVVAADREVPAVAAAAVAAITDPVAGLFSPARMPIGQPLYRSAVSAALMVPGVLAVHELLVRSSEDELLDPGVGGFFALAPGGVSIEGVSGGG